MIQLSINMISNNLGKYNSKKNVSSIFIRLVLILNDGRMINGSDFFHSYIKLILVMMTYETASAQGYAI